MAMVVQHNMTAVNSNRQLAITTKGQAKSSEKLSSGYRINRAADDAAGLTISEKMRSQVRGLKRASVNAQDGVSLIQTAEGALNEAHSILQRMNELAVQGANDTNQAIDRDAINQELDALVTELDRISETTQFNKQELLDGTFKDKKLQVGANVSQNIEITINAMNASAIGLNKTTKNVSVVCASTKTSTFTFGGKTASTSGAAKACAKADVTLTKKVSVGSGNKSWVFAVINGASVGCLAANSTALRSKAVSGLTVTTGTSIKLSWGTAQKSVAVAVDDYATANAAISKIQNAINNVSKQRSALGALQNRLEHTIANLDNVAENTESAESRIRDTDMASEMVEYSKNNILAQAGQSMLAQANQSTQGVLSLLQ